MSFISRGDKSLTSFTVPIDQLHPRHQRTNRNHLSVLAPKQPETKGSSGNQQLEVLAAGQVRRSEVKQVVISFSLCKMEAAILTLPVCCETQKL